MMEVQTYLSAFLVGLLGGVHCVGMCGGIMSALTLGVEQPVGASASGNRTKLFSFLLSYNLARITSYIFAGLVFGGLGAWVTNLVLFNQAQLILKAIAGALLIMLGLYLANWWRGLSYLERLGNKLWRLIEPQARKFIPIKNIKQAFAAGLLWGWLPCGLVYSVLIWSLSSGGAIEGGFLMLSFGLGTLPNLLAMGLFATVLRSFMQRVLVKTLSGLLVIGFGCYHIFSVVVIVF